MWSIYHTTSKNRTRNVRKDKNNYSSPSVNSSARYFISPNGSIPLRNSELIRKAIKKGMKILNIDIETSPDLSWHYGNFDVNINAEFTEVRTQVTSIGWKDLSNGKIVVKGWEFPKGDKYGFLKPDKDKKMLKEVIPILQSADILIGQNHKQFDIRKLNWRLNELRLPPLENLILIDTLKESRKVFYAPTHKLDYKSHIYGQGGKIKQTMEDCIAVAKGDSKAQKIRMEYNGKDTSDDDYVFWKEVDYYKLPKALTNMIQLFTQTDDPTFCIKCAAKKHSRFNVGKNKITGGYRFTCHTCDYKWVSLI